jgi:transcriptional regulator with XRE-family HTH domain
MGSRQRPRPAHLASKLALIRHSLGLSQNDLIERLGLNGQISRETISAFERGTREPPYPVLLRYARLVEVSTDILIDDSIELSL